MIEFKNITKRYGALTVYQNFSFSLAEGEITCILGESGSGKTTLLNMLAGLTPYGGEITPKPLCSYIFQQPRLVPSLTVFGNLKLVCGDVNAINGMLSAVDLSDKANSYPAQLSGGQAQRVAIVRAFLYPSDAILMDEPFSSLDLGLKLKIAALFLALWKKERRTAVFVTHDVDEAAMLSNRVVVLKSGRVAADIRPCGEPSADLFARAELKRELISALCGGRS